MNAKTLYAEPFSEDEIAEMWETHAGDNPECQTCRLLMTLAHVGAPSGAAAKPSPGAATTEPVSCLDDVEHREPVGLSPSQDGVTGSVSHARPDDVERARILDFAFDGVRDDHIGPRERTARLALSPAAAPEPEAEG